MTTTQKIYKAIENERSLSNRFRLEQYEDNYDGFTHSTYSGLACEVEDTLIEEGYDIEDDIPQDVIDQIVFEIF